MPRRITVLLAAVAVLVALPVAAESKGPLKTGNLVVLCERDGALFSDATVFVDGSEAGRGPVVRATVVVGTYRVVAGKALEGGRYLHFDAPAVAVGHNQTIVRRQGHRLGGVRGQQGRARRDP